MSSPGASAPDGAGPRNATDGAGGRDEIKPLKYRRIAEDLRTRIRQGEYAPGRALPGENDLMARYQVARMTVRQALAELQREGLAVARRGSGVYVSVPGSKAGPAADADPTGPAATPLDPATELACTVAHGAAPSEPGVTRTLVAVFAGDVARNLLAFASACGFAVVLVEPDRARAAAAAAWAPIVAASLAEANPHADCDVVVTNHHRAELGLVLRDALAGPSRWIGVMGNPRHPGPHLQLLADLGVPDTEIARVHRPIGLNIGSRTPPEIAISTLAGLLADRAGRPGGFTF